MLQGRIDTHQLPSDVLRGNPLGDPTTRELVVYVPPGVQPGQRLPVVLCLSGFTGAGFMMLNRGAWAPSLPERFEALLRQGSAQGSKQVSAQQSSPDPVRPMLLVMPDCFTRYGGSQFVDSDATGRYETYLLEEVLPFVRRSYPTIEGAAGVGVMGKSSGGFGAMRLGMLHPDVFSAIACHSGDMYFEYGYLPDFPKTARTLDQRGGLERFLAWFEGMPRKTNEAMTALNIVAMASCYSPSAKAPLGFDLPFDPKTGRIREEVWARWLTFDPVRLVEQHADALRRARLVFLDCGLRDEFHLQWGARILAARLRELGIDHIHEEFDDGHMGISYRYDRSLTLLSRALAPAPPA